MEDSGTHIKKRSIDEIIEHMTADLQNSDGQYIQLGFTAPTNPPPSQLWSEFGPMGPGGNFMSHAGDHPVYLQDLPMHYGGGEMSKPATNLNHAGYYYTTNPPGTRHQHVTESGEVIGTVVDGGGNIVNVVYGRQPNPGGYCVIQPREPVPHALGGFVPYHQPVENLPKPYGLFGGPDVSPQAQFANGSTGSNSGQQNGSTRAQIIESLVGNWAPNQSGTYSPFGSCSPPQPEVGRPATIQQGIQTSGESQDGQRGVKKPRIVAEVRPMRPSYSDVLAKSAPASSTKKSSTSGSSAISHQSIPEVGKSKTTASATAGSGKQNGNKNKNGKSVSSALRRQHSSGSDEQVASNTSQKRDVLSPKSSRKVPSGSTGDGKSSSGFSSSNMPRKWVSLDSLESEAKTDEVFHHHGGAPKQGGRQAETPAEGNRKLSGAGKSGKNVLPEERWDSTGATLNNHKPLGLSGSGKGVGGLAGTGTKRPAIHINNNLGSAAWCTSEKNLLKGSAKNCKGGSTGDNDKKGNASASASSAPGPTKSDSAKQGPSTSTRGQGRSSSASREGKPRRGQRSKKREAPTSPIGALCKPLGQHVTQWGLLAGHILLWFLRLLSDVLGMSCRLLAHLCSFSYEWLRLTSARGCRHLATVLARLRILERLGLHTPTLSPRGGRHGNKGGNRGGVPWWQFWNKSAAGKGAGPGSLGGVDDGGIPPSLENNISLPSTGEEAMKRLLACKGKDPYSILGVTPHCSDDDIKRYYKRQAFLVHPDKNGQPGAEEAFKILVHAFELIGEPERRKAYERRVAETQQVEQAWSELSDLLSQLHHKMEYAASTIRCTNCNKRHRRVSVDRPCYAARHCSQCKIHHSAREGDIWAESSMLGFLWHYFACMDGAVYDITEWAACQADNLRHLRPDTHAVQYRIVLGRGQGGPSAGGGSGAPGRGGRGAPEAASEPDLEDFLNNLYQSGEGGRSHADHGRHRKKNKRKK